MAKFKVGDYVRATEPVGIGHKVEVTGKIIRVFEGTTTYSVEFDEYIKGHDCGGQRDGIKDKYGYCWNCSENGLQLVPANPSIHIYTNGTTTTAILKDGKNVVKTAHAKCSPDDTYDFAIGAKLAFDRLMWFEPVKEVKRKAKTGEWVKVINPYNVPNDNGIDVYKKGDILQIIDDGCWVTFKEGTAENGKLYALINDEYVVLENYKPDTIANVANNSTSQINLIAPDMTAKQIVDEISKLKKETPLEVIINGEKYIKEA